MIDAELAILHAECLTEYAKELDVLGEAPRAAALAERAGSRPSCSLRMGAEHGPSLPVAELKGTANGSSAVDPRDHRLPDHALRRVGHRHRAPRRSSTRWSTPACTRSRRSEAPVSRRTSASTSGRRSWTRPSPPSTGACPSWSGSSDLTTAGTVARAEYAQQAGATAVMVDPGLLLGSQRARDRAALQLRQRCDLDPDHGLQQPGDLRDRHVPPLLNNMFETIANVKMVKESTGDIQRMLELTGALRRASCRSTTAATRWCSRR